MQLINKTAISRVKPELLAEFDAEIAAWAERIVATRARLEHRWPEASKALCRYSRQHRAKRPYAAPRLVLAYLSFIADEIGSRPLMQISPQNRRLLGRTIARVEERLQQLGAPL